MSDQQPEDDAVQSMQTEIAYFLLFSFMTGMGLLAASAQALTERPPVVVPPVVIVDREVFTNGQKYAKDGQCYWLLNKDNSLTSLTFLYVLVDEAGIKVRPTHGSPFIGGADGHFAESVRNMLKSKGDALKVKAASGRFDTPDATLLPSVLNDLSGEVREFLVATKSPTDFVCRLRIRVALSETWDSLADKIPGGRPAAEPVWFDVARCAGDKGNAAWRTWCSPEARARWGAV